MLRRSINLSLMILAITLIANATTFARSYNNNPNLRARQVRAERMQKANVAANSPNLKLSPIKNRGGGWTAKESRLKFKEGGGTLKNSSVKETAHSDSDDKAYKDEEARDGAKSENGGDSQVAAGGEPSL